MRWRHRLALVPGLMLTVCLAGCGAFGQGTTETDRVTTTENAVNTVVGPIRIDDAYVRVTGRTATLRVSLTNQGRSPDRLSGVAVEHGTPTPVAVALPPGRTVDLDVGSGLALPVTGRVPRVGEMVTVSLHFPGAGEAAVTVPVVAPDAA